MLIIDSNEDNCRKLLNIFDSEYNILIASNEKQALTTLINQHKSVNIILLNTMTTDMDSTEFMKSKNSNRLISEIPVVLITNDDSVKSQQELLDLGANDYITKPFVKEIVLRRVNNVLFSNRHIKNKYIAITQPN